MADFEVAAILEELNGPQRQAVCHGDSPLLIIAGAGTGKTKTLAHRVALQISQGVEPSRILLLTFTRRAAAEMTRRVDAILRELVQSDESASGARKSAVRRLVGGTFHSVGTRLLRRYGRLIGLEPEFTILDRGDAEDLMQVLRNDMDLARTGTRFPKKGTCVEIYGRCVNTQERISQILPRHFPWCLEFEDELKQLFEAYVDAKERHQVLDYDDLLLFWQALVNEPRAQKEISERFDRIFVDEYQDTNTLQADILKQMSPEGTGVTVVGDDAQSIYSFRSATVRNILDFPSQFAGTEVVKLEQNYRSTQQILNATNEVIAESSEAHPKTLWSENTSGARPWIIQCVDDEEQSEWVIERILEHRERGTELRQQAVLFRASHHSAGLEVELARRNVPFHKYGGLKFVETAHVKDMLGFLRLAENPRGLIAGMRVLMLMPGIGGRRAQQLLESLAEAGGNFEAWQAFKAPASTEPFWNGFVRLMTRLKAAGDEGMLQTAIEQVHGFYTPLLELRYDHAASRTRDLEQLQEVASRFPDRTTFLSEMTLDPPSSTQDLAGDPHLDDDYLILSTIHSAKGLEWDAAYIAVTRFVGDVVQIALGIRIFVVNGWRYDVVAHRQEAGDGLNAAGGCD